MNANVDLVRRLTDAAAAAIVDERPALENPRGHVRDVTVELVLTGAGQVHEAGCYVEWWTGRGGVTWEYMTWTTTDAKAGRSVRLVNGEQLEEYPLEHPALVEAGEHGWELVSVVHAGGRQDHALYFKWPKAED